MNFKQSFILALKSLSASKMRAFLTMLGIIIGIAAVIILVSLVNGFKASLVNEFESLGANLVNVNINSRGSNRTVDVDDMYEYVDENDEISAWWEVPSELCERAGIRFNDSQDLFLCRLPAECPQKISCKLI